MGSYPENPCNNYIIGDIIMTTKAKAFQKTAITLATVGDAIDLANGNNRATRRAMQGIAIVGFEQFLDCGRLNILDRLYKTAKLIGAHGQLETFITSHGNIKLENKGKVNAKFVKSNKREATVNDLSDWWYNFEKPESAPAKATDLNTMMSAFIKSINSKVENHKLKEGQDELAPELITFLESYEGLNECNHVAPELKAVA